VDSTQNEVYYEETVYQAGSWAKPRRVIIQSVRPAGELFFTDAFFVTNLGDAFSSQTIVKSYQKRGSMENYIKKAEHRFFFDAMCSHDFVTNEVRMMFSLLTYNLTNWLRTLCFLLGAKDADPNDSHEGRESS